VNGEQRILPLFDGPVLPLRVPARTGDPASSQAAAVDVVVSGRMRAQQRAALEAVRDHPGCTSMELAQVCDLDRYQLARRLPELERAGQVRRGWQRICRVSGRPAVTWRAAEGRP
jgi:hypothetical protein